MHSHLPALLIGGLLPALMYALTGIFTKASTNAGIDVASYLVVVGLSIVLVGLGCLPFIDERSLILKSGAYAFGVGACWGVGMASFSYVLLHYKEPISRLVPFHNAAPLIAIVLAFLFFAEWKEVELTKLIIGAALITVGAVVVSFA